GKFQAEGNNLTGEAKFKLETLDTGISKRTEHMKEKYLETKTYPMAEFVLTKLPLPADFFSGGAASASKVDFTGKLKLHGKEKELKGKADVKRSGDKVTAHFDLPTKITDFGIEKPSFLGISVDEEVAVSVDTQAKVAAAAAAN